MIALPIKELPTELTPLLSSTVNNTCNIVTGNIKLLFTVTILIDLKLTFLTLKNSFTIWASPNSCAQVTQLLTQWNWGLVLGQKTKSERSRTFLKYFLLFHFKIDAAKTHHVIDFTSLFYRIFKSVYVYRFCNSIL